MRWDGLTRSVSASSSDTSDFSPLSEPPDRRVRRLFSVLAGIVWVWLSCMEQCHCRTRPLSAPPAPALTTCRPTKWRRIRFNAAHYSPPCGPCLRHQAKHGDPPRNIAITATRGHAPSAIHVLRRRRNPTLVMSNEPRQEITDVCAVGKTDSARGGEVAQGIGCRCAKIRCQNLNREPTGKGDGADRSSD